jgi:AP endonuclease-1
MEFTFWPHRQCARHENKGWRLDYFVINNNTSIQKRIINSEILTHYEGSDHCPIKLTYKI